MAKFSAKLVANFRRSLEGDLRASFAGKIVISIFTKTPPQISPSNFTTRFWVVTGPKIIFDTFRQLSRRAKKRQKSPKSLKNLFDNFRAAPVFRPLLSESGRGEWKTQGGWNTYRKFGEKPLPQNVFGPPTYNTFSPPSFLATLCHFP